MRDHTENSYGVIYADEDIIAVSKAHGLHVIPDRYGNETETLVDLLRRDFGKVMPVHRLDAGTGGIVLFAKNAESHRNLCSQFEARMVEKKYLAITSSRINDQTLMLPIAAGNHGRFKVNFKSGKQAATTFLMSSTNGKESAVIARPHTGRTHQIRVHLKALKAPLYCDWLYNAKIADKRLTLFAYSILIAHPRSDLPLILNAPLSDFMIHAAELLELSLENVYL